MPEKIREKSHGAFVKVGDNPNIPISQTRTIDVDYDVESGYSTLLATFGNISPSRVAVRTYFNSSSH